MIEEGWATVFSKYDVFASTGPAIPTRGIKRWVLQMLRHYWVNSGLAVAFMLILGWGSGYLALWPIFGAANQLLAALALSVITCWLISHRRPLWYTLLPAIFMMVTSITMLLWLLANRFLPKWPTSAPLVITDLLVLALTLGIIVLAVRRWSSRAASATTVT